MIRGLLYWYWCMLSLVVGGPDFSSLREYSYCLLGMHLYLYKVCLLVSLCPCAVVRMCVCGSYA